MVYRLARRRLRVPRPRRAPSDRASLRTGPAPARRVVPRLPVPDQAPGGADRRSAVTRIPSSTRRSRSRAAYFAAKADALFELELYLVVLYEGWTYRRARWRASPRSRQRRAPPRASCSRYAAVSAADARPARRGPGAPPPEGAGVHDPARGRRGARRCSPKADALPVLRRLLNYAPHKVDVGRAEARHASRLLRRRLRRRLPPRSPRGRRLPRQGADDEGAAGQDVRAHAAGPLPRAEHVHRLPRVAAPCRTPRCAATCTRVAGTSSTSASR